MLNKPLVSIIMPTFNSEKTILNSIHSILAQDYQNWELIIIDDHSSDSTMDLINNLKDLRIKVINNNQNYGVGISRKIGFLNSIGQYIAFIDSDDIWISTKLSFQVEFMIKNNYTFTITKVIKKILGSNEVIGKVKPPKKMSYHNFLWNTSIVTSSVLIKKSILNEKMFSTLRIGEDFLTWLNILKPGNKVYLVNLYLVNYMVRKDSLSSNKIKSALNIWKVYKKDLKLNLLFALFYFSLYSINSLLKVLFSKYLN